MNRRALLRTCDQVAAWRRMRPVFAQRACMPVRGTRGWSEALASLEAQGHYFSLESPMRGAEAT